MKRPHGKKPFNGVISAFRGLDVSKVIKKDPELLKKEEVNAMLKVIDDAEKARRKRREYDAMRTAQGSSLEVDKNVIVNGVIKWKPVDKTAARVVAPASDIHKPNLYKNENQNSH